MCCITLFWEKVRSFVRISVDSNDSNKEYIILEDVVIVHKENTINQNPIITVLHDGKTRPYFYRKTLFKYSNISFILMTDDFNYYEFLDPEFYEYIKWKDEETIVIKLDRFKIRHCNERFISINIKTKIITWADLSLSNNKKWDTIHDLSHEKMKISTTP
jgi:hypothetical protein